MSNSFEKALANLEHHKALGNTLVFVDDIPLDQVTAVKVGCAWRMDIPVGVDLMHEADGVTFQAQIDFESRSANGTNAHQLQGDVLSRLLEGLSSKPRAQLVDILQDTLLPPIKKRSDDYHNLWCRNEANVRLLTKLIANAY